MNNLLKPADNLHSAIATFLKDWNDGDFDLPRLAEIHVEGIREKYLELGKAIYKETLEGPKTFPPELNDKRTSD